MRGEFLDLNGVRLYYYAAGSRGAGEPIVLIHGFPTSGHLWRDVVPLLPTGHRVVVIDLIGFGRSDPARGAALDIRGHALRTVSMMDQLGIERACFVGHELGGGVSLALAVEWPHRVSRVCAVSSVAFDAWPIRTLRLARRLLPVTRLLSQSVLRSFLRSELIRGFADHDTGAHDLDVFLRAFESADGRDSLLAHIAALEPSETRALSLRLREIAVPTSIVWGANDPFLSRHVGERLAAGIRDSTLTIVPDARHFAPRDTPNAVAHAVTSLLSR
jgi:pimeloyl-ACP methyl ester carboxylesterase